MCARDIEFAYFYDFFYWILELFYDSVIFVFHFIIGYEKSIMIMYLLLLAIIKKRSLQSVFRN